MSELKIERWDHGDKTKIMPLHEEVASAKLQGGGELQVLRSMMDNTLFFRFKDATYTVTLRAIVGLVLEHRQREGPEWEEDVCDTCNVVKLLKWTEASGCWMCKECIEERGAA